MNRIIALYLSLHLIVGAVSPYIDVIKENTLSANVISEVCVETGTSEYFPITDERGNIILTKKEFNRDCTLTKEVQGACSKWETVREDFIIDAEDYNAHRSRNHEGAMGSLLAMIGAYDQLEHLWSGWKGYCEIGTKTNFDWASDPMFWAGLVASAIMDGSQGGEYVPDADGNMVLQGEGFFGASDMGKSIQSSLNNADEFMMDGLGAWVGGNAGRCLVSSGFDMVNNLYQHAQSNNADDMCDPVDEFCGDEAEQTEESDLITIDKVQYEDMVAQNPELADYIIIIDEHEGILTVRYKNVNEMDGMAEADMEQLKEMKEKLANMKLIFSSAITAVKLGSCIATGGDWGGSINTASDTGDAPAFSIKNGLGMAISSLPSEWLGPYGVLIKAALQILLNFLYSFQDIDSCHNQDDADEQGARHAKTAESLPHDLCHFVYDECVDNCGDGFLGLAKELRGYNFCCYDQILTKVLVVQLKAQLGRDWSHCTGITLRDLNFVSFKQCTAADMANGIDGGVEGIHNDKYYDPQATFQYKNKCIDLTEFKDYLSAQIGDDIDLSDFDSIFDDVQQTRNTQIENEGI